MDCQPSRAHRQSINQRTREEIMKLIVTTMAACALLTGASQSTAPEKKEKEHYPGLKSEETKVIKATVDKIDKEKRKVTLKGERGKTVTVKVPETARNFDQIKP